MWSLAQVMVFGILLSGLSIAQSPPTDVALPQFQGRKVTLTKPVMEDEFTPKGPATVCVEGPPQRQCFTAPNDYGRDPRVSLLKVNDKIEALFFTAAGGGVSGFPIYFALLRPGDGKELENLLPPELTRSVQGQHVFWSHPTISDAQLFVVATAVWGVNESHQGVHRFIISAYVLKDSEFGERYYLEDEYLTARTYAYWEDDILAAEKAEILARLLRAKAAATSPVR
jgi:hypothetical protein